MLVFGEKPFSRGPENPFFYEGWRKINLPKKPSIPSNPKVAKGEHKG